jgi:hypothetical protein
MHLQKEKTDKKQSIYPNGCQNIETLLWHWWNNEKRGYNVKLAGD